MRIKETMIIDVKFVVMNTAELSFLVADTQLYKRLGPSVRPSVGPLVRRSVGEHKLKSGKLAF